MRPEDEPFLRDLQAQVDSERLGLQYWSQESVELAQKILAQQYNAHSAYYRTVKNNWDTKDCIIELEGKAVGRFIVTQGAEEIYLAEIAVDRAHRGKGLGQAVIEATKSECVQSKRVLRLRVDVHNSAIHFYLGLGFAPLEQQQTHVLMEWVPPNLQGRKLHFSPQQG
ncbi:MAG TPA: GNAT family N-acetyltransferase [Opitutaceae bacterium]